MAAKKKPSKKSKKLTPRAKPAGAKPAKVKPAKRKPAKRKAVKNETAETLGKTDEERHGEESRRRSKILRDKKDASQDSAPKPHAGPAEAGRDALSPRSPGINQDPIQPGSREICRDCRAWKVRTRKALTS